MIRNVLVPSRDVSRLFIFLNHVGNYGLVRSTLSNHCVKIDYGDGETAVDTSKFTGNEFHANPRLDRCERMMVQVEQTDLVVLFPHHEKYLKRQNGW